MVQEIRNQLDGWGAFWGVAYALVGLGFYFSPLMLLMLGAASASTFAALQNLLFIRFRWHFMLLGLLLAFITVLFYLHNQGVSKLSVADIKPHRLFIGSLTLAFSLTYLIFFFTAIFVLQ